MRDKGSCSSPLVRRRARYARAQQTASERPGRLRPIDGSTSASGGTMGRRRATPAVVTATMIQLMLLLLVAAEAVAGRSSNDTSAAQAVRAGGHAYDSEDNEWVRSTGRGYSFSSGSAQSAASSSAGYIAFVPDRVDFGRVDACAPRSFFVNVENRGPWRVRLQRADFTREDLALATDVAGIHLDPGGRFLVELRYLPTEPAAHYGAFFRVLTSSGRFALPIHSRVEPNPAGVQALRVTVPIGARVHHTITLRNPKPTPLSVTDVFTLEDHLHLSFPGGESAITPRRPDLHHHRDQEQADQHAEHTPGVWEFAPGASKPLVTLSFRAEEAGVFLSYVNINADRQSYLMVPVRVTVLAERALTVEPTVVDVGVLTSRRQPHRERVTVYNTLASPVTIDGVRASPSASKSSKSSQSVMVDVRMVEKPFLLPSRTRADVTLQLEFPDSVSDNDSSTCSSIRPSNAASTGAFVGNFDVAVSIETTIVSDGGSFESSPMTTSTTPLGVRIVGKTIDGAVAYRQRDTLFALTLPLTRVFPPKSSQDRANEMEMNVSVPLPMSVMTMSDVTTTSTIMEAGTRLTRMFRLQNQFNVPLELQRVYIDDDTDEIDDELALMPPSTAKEVTLNLFNRSNVAAPGAFWPALELDVWPALDGLAIRGDGVLLAPRAYSLVVETNATVHEIPLHLYHGIVQVDATRGLSRHALSGYVNESTSNGSEDREKTPGTKDKTAKKTETDQKTKTKKQKTRDMEEKEAMDDHFTRTCASVYGSEGPTVISDMLSKPRTPKKRQRESPYKPQRPFDARVCRSLQFDLGKIAVRGDARASETLTITNWNPIPIEMALSRVAQDELFTFDISAEMKTSDVSGSAEGGVPETLSALHAQWQANASFVRLNERRLAALSTTQHEDIADGRRSDDGDASSSSFVLPPGHSVSLHLDMKLVGTLGMFTAHVLTLRTPFEVIHVHAFLDIIDGIVEPVHAEVELRPSFAGQAQMVELRYRNTINHAVRITNVTVPHGMAIAAFTDMIPAKAEKVLTLYFVPSDVQVCAGRRMVVDCLLPPLDVPVDNGDNEGGDGRNNALSDFGTYVSPSDLIALVRRSDFWAKVATHNNGRAVLKGALSGLVELETDLMRDVQPVTISIPLARPRIVVSGASQPVGDGSLTEAYSVRRETEMEDVQSSLPVKVHFPMTQLFYVSRAFVNVTNPANSTINAELVCAYAERRFFYMCDEQSDGVVDDDRECLAKWRALVVDAASRPTCSAGSENTGDDVCRSGLTVDAPLFFFRHRVVEIPAGKHALLGPIYYLPGDKHQVTAELYVRNQLSHIEPIHLIASSGKPTLALSMLTPVERGVSIKNSSGARSKDQLQRGDEHRINDILEFAVGDGLGGVDQSDEGSPEQRPSDFSRRANLQIASTGEFDLRITKVWLVDRATDSDDDNQVGDDLPFEIVAFPGHITLWRSKDTEETTPVVGENGAFAVLTPGDQLQFGVVFRPTCATATTQVNLLLETNDDRRIVPLTGTITTEAAFKCLRQQVSYTERVFQRALWVISVLVGSGCVLLVLLDLVQTAVVSSVFPSRSTRVAYSLVDKNTTTMPSETVDLPTRANGAAGGSDAGGGGLSDAVWLLDEMEQALFKPMLPVSLSAVNSVLERRQRGVFDTAAILKALSGNSERTSTGPKTPRRSEDNATAPRPEQLFASGSDNPVLRSSFELLESAALLASTVKPDALAVGSLTRTPADETIEQGEEGVHFETKGPSTPLTTREKTPTVEVDDLAASSHSTATVKSMDSEYESRVGGKTGQRDTAGHPERGEQAEGSDVAKIEGEGDKPSNSAGFNFSFDFPRLEKEKDSGGKETASKGDNDPAWSLWDSKSWWQSSTENNSLESNRSLNGAKEGGGVLLPLRPLDSPPALGIGVGGGLGSVVRDFAPSTSGASLRLDTDFAGVALNNAGSSTRSRAVSATKAPPGFTPADATPLEARAAFEKLCLGVFSASSDSGRHLGDTGAGIRYGLAGFGRGISFSPSDGSNENGGALALLAALEPSSQPLGTPFSSGMSLFDSSSSSDVELGGGHSRIAPLGEIGSKRLASFRGIWTDGGISSGGGGDDSAETAAKGPGPL